MLTIDRNTVTAATLNTLFEEAKTQMSVSLPPNLRVINGVDFVDAITLSESDKVAMSIETELDIIPALSSLANDFFGSKATASVDEESTSSELKVITGRVLPQIEQILDQTAIDQINQIQQMITKQGVGNAEDIFALSATDSLNTSYGTEIAQSSSNLLPSENESEIPTAKFLIQLNPKDESLLGISVAGGFISAEQLSVVNPSLVENIAKATDQEIAELDLLIDPPVASFANVATLSFSSTTSSFTTQRFITNSVGSGWFSSGFKGTEHFEELGVEEWGLGESKAYTQINLGTQETFRGFENWFIGKSYQLGSDETFGNSWPEGITPTKPCSSSGGSELKFENLSTQCNGSNQDFTISEAYKSGSLRVYWNGQRQSAETITETGSTTFQTLFTPSATDVLVIDYVAL